MTAVSTSPVSGHTTGSVARTFCSRTLDVDAHSRAQPDWRLHYDQLSGGTFSGSIEQIQLPGLCLVRESANRAMRQRGELRPETYSLALSQEASGECIFGGQQAVGDALMIGCSDELDILSPAQFGLIGIVVDALLLRESWERMFGASPPAWLETQTVARNSIATARLRTLCGDIFASIPDIEAKWIHDSALHLLRDTVLLEMIEALPPSVGQSPSPTLAQRKRLVDHACDIALSQSEQPMSILELCRSIGASRRKLNYCFQEVLGMTPVKYLRAIRLNAVRRALSTPIQGEASIGDIATQWGFWHLSQFALDYKRQFGELPSQTLLRVR